MNHDRMNDIIYQAYDIIVHENAYDINSNMHYDMNYDIMVLNYDIIVHIIPYDIIYDMIYDIPLRQQPRCDTSSSLPPWSCSRWSARPWSSPPQQ
jgi:hypothetical protein